MLKLATNRVYIRCECCREVPLRNGPSHDELNTNQVPCGFAMKDFSTFYDLYIDLFENESSG